MNSVIRLEKNARVWDDGFPIGNGRLGAMIMGKPDEETIFVNEETLWYGPKRDRKNPDALQNVAEIRRLLMAGEVQKAQFLAKMALTSTPKYLNPFQPAGDLRICLMNHKDKAENYARQLDLDNALATVEYKMRGASYRREHLVSHRYNVLAIRMTTDAPEGLTVSVNISRKPFEENTGKIGLKTAANWGQCGEGGVRYFSAVRLAAKGAEVSTMGDFVYTENAREVTIYLSSATSFGGRDHYRQECLDALDRAEAAGYDEIRRIHLEEYHRLYRRVRLELAGAQTPSLPLDQMLEKLRGGCEADLNTLTVLLFQYAKYLMISSSYDCVMPANLQGIWNGSYTPPWECKYTININTEMNYWMAEPMGLPECHRPLFRLIDRLAQSGRETARRLYGAQGFCAHHNTDLWANTDPDGIFDSSPFWPMGGAWLSLHLYEHFLFTQDEKFLAEQALPVMREAIRFCEDTLTEAPDGTFLTGPSLSPENTYLTEKGQKGCLCMAPAMDIQILRQLITWYLEGCDRLKISPEGGDRLRQILSRLPQSKVSSDGRLMEWNEEYGEAEPGHRHISHLFALHPGTEITADTPELFQAAKNTLDFRLSHGGGHTGWSRAWVTCFLARLRDGEAARDSIRALLDHSVQMNLLDTHPPFQIDGNFGIAAAILEMIVQSHAGYVDLLPALPNGWPDGALLGVRVRGGASADIEWKNGSLSALAMTALRDSTFRLRYRGKETTVALRAGERTDITL